MLEAFAELEKHGRAITAFIGEAQRLLNEIHAVLKKVDERCERIEGAHETVLGWMADIDEEVEHEIAAATATAATVAAEAAATATAAAAAVEAKAAEVEAAAVEKIEELVETQVEEITAVEKPAEPVKETPPAEPVKESPPTEPVKETPVVGAGVEVKVEKETPPEAQRRRKWIEGPLSRG